MKTQLRVPTLPESIADATVAGWHKRPGEPVRRDENLVDLETDKVVLEVPAPTDGVLAEIHCNEGDLVQAEQVLALIEAGVEAEMATAGAAGAAGAAGKSSEAQAETATPASEPNVKPQPQDTAAEPFLAPAARRLVKELNLDPSEIPGSGKDGRILKSDVMAYLDARERRAPQVDPEAVPPSPPQTPVLTGEAERPEQRVPMTRLRARIAERLVQAQQSAAILTTFNEVNLKPVMDLRRRYKDAFEKQHEVRLGLMSFFVKASVEALQRFPVVNASVDDKDIIYHGYYDIGIAVSSPRGLVVPILRNCDKLTFSEIEKGVVEFGRKAKDGSLSYEELSGGTFSITNGGVFGSLVSTPILNPPQSAILGMHKIQERPVVENGEIVVRPMMFLALSYDHRLIDGREAVQCLVTIKEVLEDPARLLLQI